MKNYMNKKKILLITIPIFLIILIAILLVVNNIMFYRVNDIDLLQQSGFKTNIQMEVEQNNTNNKEAFKYTKIVSKEKLLYGIKKYGIKAQCEYYDDELSFSFVIYEVRYAKTEVKNYRDAIVGKNTSFALKDIYVVIPNGDVEQLKRVFVDLGFKLEYCNYKIDENDSWEILERI